MNKVAIEKASRRLLGEIWDNRDRLWRDREPTRLKAINLEKICQYLGYTIEEQNSLGRFGGFETAGAVNRRSGVISISKRFPEQVQRFTTAHEIAHLRLHQQLVMHRDRPTERFDDRGTRPAVEREADYFASCLLMPRGLLTEEFERRFGKSPIHFNENTCHLLNPDNHEELLYAEEDSLKRELTLARLDYYNGRPIPSLARAFGVTATAMAIRLRELKFIKYP